jgi:hypothetical protein
MKTLVTLLVCSLLLAPPASDAGERSPEEKNPDESFPQTQALTKDHPTKDPAKALHAPLVHMMLSMTLGGAVAAELGSASLAAAAIGYGAVVAPSIGNFYAEDYLRGAVGIGIRLVSWCVVFRAMAERMDFKTDVPEHHTISDTLALTALGVAVSSTVWNIATAPASARKFNARHQQTGFMLLPVVDPVSKTGGLALCMTW